MRLFVQIEVEEVVILLWRRSSLSNEPRSYLRPQPSHSAPVTPSDSDPQWPYSDQEAHSSKARYEASVEGVWWWKRPLGVRRSTCRRCGASSSSRPLQMTPCVPQDGYDRRPTSDERPLNIRQLYL
ncbi:unnamed protein product [Colias eurytheme]|nr:unnamed protein product [Colias eurytheme]